MKQLIDLSSKKGQQQKEKFVKKFVELDKR